MTRFWPRSPIALRDGDPRGLMNFGPASKERGHDFVARGRWGSQEVSSVVTNFKRCVFLQCYLFTYA